jgi:hypothetical protein
LPARTNVSYAFGNAVIVVCPDGYEAVETLLKVDCSFNAGAWRTREKAAKQSLPRCHRATQRARLGSGGRTLSWRRRAWNAGAIACVLALARIAHGQSVEAIELRIAPDARGCVTDAALRARIASLRVRVEDASGLGFAIDASQESVVLEVRRDDVVIATRRFDALPERCADRLQTIALVIALAIEHAVSPDADEDDEADASAEPEAKAAAVAPEAAPVQRAPKAEPVQPTPVESDDGEIERSEPALRTIVGVGAAYGLLPEVAGTLAIGVELPSAALRIGLGALVTSEANTDLAGGRALTRLAGARAYGCASGEGWVLDLQACAGVVLGVVSATGRDYAPSTDATGTLLAPLLRLGARYPARGVLSVGLALEGLVNLVRPELQVSGNAGEVSSVPLLGAALSLEGVLAVP